ncbi:CIS tube protein [Haladaptatus sp. DFWS20]|uniref:CIS tube protein n=1 Tax=Haladaptatus sp. DFWS20 TaxID=3403467 RepID=UPI003EBE08BC
MAASPTDPGLQDARIQILSGTQAGTAIPVMFNPTEYSIEKGVSYAQQSPPGRGAPLTQFVSGESETLSMELFFDTHDDEATDVRYYTELIDSLLTIDTELHAPPVCKFVWGSLVDFESVLESASKQFTMFDRNGLPVRARVTVTFRKYDPPVRERSENPLASADRTKLWEVKSGDTLWSIAGTEYADPTEWRPIADANGIENPRVLRPGTKLVVPPLEGE